jgi:hypothetical protein
MTNASSEGLAIPEFASRRSAVSQTQEQAFADIGSDLLWLANMCKCIELLDQGDALGALGLIQKMEPFASKCEIGHTHCFSGDEVSLRNLLWTCVYATGPGAFQDSKRRLVVGRSVEQIHQILLGFKRVTETVASSDRRYRRVLRDALAC